MKIGRRGGRLDLVGQSSQLVDAALANGKPVQRFQQWLRAAASWKSVVFQLLTVTAKLLAKPT